MTPARSITALHLQAAADIWRVTGSEPQRAFVATLESWAASFRARSEAAAINEQPDLFGGMNV